MPNQIIKSVNFATAGSSRQLFFSDPILSSHSSDWTDLSIEYHRLPATDTEEHVSPYLFLAIALGSTASERWLDGHFQTENVRTGDITIVPAGVRHRAYWQQEIEFLVLNVESALLEQIGRELKVSDRTQIVPQSPPLQDPLLQGIAMSLKDELQSRDTGNQLYVDQLSTTLALHLLRKYTSRQPQIRDYSGGLSRYRLNTAIDYIQSHLDQSIKLADIANVLGMSQYYFCRLFHQSMGLSPYRYVLQQRVERAKQLLRKQREKAIADIALECGFTHQSHLAKHFKQITGMTPKTYREN